MNQQIIKNKLLKFLYKKQTELYIYFSQIKNENININDIETLKQIFNNAKQERYIRRYSILPITNKKNIIIDYGISYCLNNNYRNYYLSFRENLYLKNKIQYFYINKHIIKYWLFFSLFVYFTNYIIKQLAEQLTNKEYRLKYYQEIINNSENYIPDYISGVYIIINKVNFKVYIGSSINIKDRKEQHLSLLSHGNHCNNHLQGAIIKYGIENFYFKILEICEGGNKYKDEDKSEDGGKGESENESGGKDENINIIDILRKKEKHYLYYYNANNPHCGYNQYKIEKCLNNKENKKRKKVSMEYFNEWADLYVNHNMSIQDIVLMYDNICCATTVGRILKSGGVRLRDCYSDIYREKQVKGLVENNKKKWDKWNELYNNGDGLKCKEIARLYKVSENNVKEKLKKVYGCDVKRKEIIYKGKHLHYKLKWEELYKSGLAILKIAKMYNVDHKVVKKVLEIELLKDIKGEKNIHNPYKKGFDCFNEEVEYKKEREERKRKKQELWGRIRELWGQGKSDIEIADVCCLPVKKVYDYLKSYKRKKNNK